MDDFDIFAAPTASAASDDAVLTAMTLDAALRDSPHDYDNAYAIRALMQTRSIAKFDDLFDSWSSQPLSAIVDVIPAIYWDGVDTNISIHDCLYSSKHPTRNAVSKHPMVLARDGIQKYQPRLPTVSDTAYYYANIAML